MNHNFSLASDGLAALDETDGAIAVEVVNGEIVSVGLSE